MLPEPLHPAIVHFPIVLVVLLPISALLALWAIRRGASARRAWLVPLAFAAVLVVSAWVAVETGEAEEERVEEVVSEGVLHEHEEAGERFLVFSGVFFLVAGMGLLGGTVGAASRFLATVGTVGLLVAGYQVGEAGGELVYVHGAAGAYVRQAGGVGDELRGTAPRDEEDDEHEERKEEEPPG